MVTRRDVLAGGVGAAVVGASGCLTDGTLSDIRGDGGDAPEWCQDDDADYRCGEGEPIDVREDFDDDDEVIYHDNGTVQWVFGRSRNGPSYRTAPFEEWAGVRCADTGARAAVDRTYERLPFDREEALDRGLRSGIGTPDYSDGISAKFEVFVGDEDVLPSDPVDLETAVEAAPAYAETTITLADEEYECVVPVYVETYEELGVLA